jgi:hypothetical protein
VLSGPTPPFVNALWQLHQLGEVMLYSPVLGQFLTFFSENRAVLGFFSHRVVRIDSLYPNPILFKKQFRFYENSSGYQIDRHGGKSLSYNSWSEEEEAVGSKQ